MIGNMKIFWETKKFANIVGYHQVFLFLENIYNLKSSKNKIQ